MVLYAHYRVAGAFLALIFSQLLSASTVFSLSSSAPTKSPAVRRVAIIGTGVAGLSLAHALENSPDLMDLGGGPIEATLFDARPSLNFQAGAGVQLNGGMSVLHKINPTVQRAVADAALPMTGVRTRARPWNAGSEPFSELLALDFKEVVERAGGDTAKALIINGELMFYSIMRGALQESLLETLPSETQKRILFGKCLTGITNSDNGNGIKVEFMDGSAFDDFDMVVGCDGIKTAVKEYVETGKISKDPKEREGRSAVYSGIRIRYAVQDGDESTTVDDNIELRQYFGEGAYSLSGIYGAGAGRPPVKCAFTTWLDKDYIGPIKKKDAKESVSVSENPDWTQDSRADDCKGEMLQQLKDCFVPDVELAPVIADADRFFELGVYFHNPFSLGGWSKAVPNTGGRYCTLCGDAAHAMPPFLGQGSNQAIQDAYLLAKKIHQHNAGVLNTVEVSEEEDASPQDADLPKMLKEYEHTRWVATTSISAKAGFLGYLEASEAEFLWRFRDVFFRTMGIIGVAERIFLGAATPKL